MKKILIVFGTRPEAIKMAPLVKEFKKYPEKFSAFVCVTGQHRQMLDQVLDLFQIVPDYDLDIMKKNQDLYDVTSNVLLGLRNILCELNPDLVLVHGDTTTSVATALAAFYKKIDVGHVEAGLRTYDVYSPFPEELNRQITSKIARFHFAPTTKSKENLLREHIDEKNIFVTGNTVIDALYLTIESYRKNQVIKDSIENLITANGYNTQRLTCGKKIVLITGHRRENFGEGFINICMGIKSLAERYKDVDFIYPMHLNPNVRNPINKVFGNDLLKYDNLFFIEPLEYLTFVYMMDKSYIVLTDSGGIQEEAPSLGKPVLVMRDTTERPEAVSAGTVKLVGTNTLKIVNEVSKLLDDEKYYSSMSKAANPYGDGKACARIIESI